MQSTSATTLVCDGCGQPASPEHLALRLRRLEEATRYRPIHVQTVFLGAASPDAESDYLYSSKTPKGGEALAILTAAGIAPTQDAPESALAEFQRKGFVLAHVAECPLDAALDASARAALYARLFPAVLARLRRSLKPRRIVLLSEELEAFAVPLRESGVAEIEFAPHTAV